MPSAAALNYNYITNTRRAAGRRKAAKCLVSSGFAALPHTGHCIKDSDLLDPPYNTGAKDWKYNNDYVDSSDAYRHSKCLSMMEKRLKIAKKLLNPKDSMLIVKIDEKEYLHLGCLLEEMFSEARIQMISSVVSVQGSVRPGMFTRSDEYIFFVFIGNATAAQAEDDMLNFEADQKHKDHV